MKYLNPRLIAVTGALVGIGFLLGWPTWWKIVLGAWLAIVVISNVDVA